MQFLTRTLLKGLSVFLPVALSLYFLIWLVQSSENLLKDGIIALIGGYYFPGLGLITLVVIVFLTGLLMYPWITRTVIEKVDLGFRRIPIISTIYGPIKDLFVFLGPEDVSQKLGQPVMVKLPNSDFETVGFVTREDLSELPEAMQMEEMVLVYVQMSMQLGGFTFLVPKSSTRPIDVTSEEGLRFILTAGLSAPKQRKENERQGQEKNDICRNRN